VATISKDYTIRRLTQADAKGVPDLTLQVNGPGYFHDEAYDPERLFQKNQSGELISVVAVDNNSGRVVGHCALERPEHERFGEVGEAMVLPEHQQRNLLGRMGAALFAEALREGIEGFFAQTVTHHVHSQRSAAAFGAVPTGVKLGWWVQSGFGLNDFPQRVTPIVYLRYFSQTPRRKVFLPEHHREIATRIFAQLGREVEFGEESGFDSPGEVVFVFDELHRIGMITVVRPGAESCKQVLAAYHALTEKSHADAFFVDIFVDQSAAPRICAELERSEFFFSGIQPHVKFDRDLLRLQIQHTPIDLRLIQTVNDLRRELLTYVGRERDRISK
jgi:hypothetical protein